ncbi:hypothetical protein RvY_04410 [Ramazzottius varieornatus]|uniref:Uncharacterized protein n=1 Tax=Ramazzottius varieornatus TaxID=947166 RepID=A0A1D1URL3_RAMVA|nr:hypothetical protein RvY_04410 [Ramazzottius varieornatus]
MAAPIVNPQRKPVSNRQISLALFTNDYECDFSPELEQVRSQINEVIASSDTISRLLIWDRRHNFMSKPFLHTMKSMQHHNVHGILFLLRVQSEHRYLLSNIHDMVTYFWATSRRTAVTNTTRNEKSDECPPLSLAFLVHGSAGIQSMRENLRHRVQTQLLSLLPAIMITEDMVKVKFVCFPEEAELLCHDLARWLKKNAKRYAIRRAFEMNHSLWSTVSWNKVLQREGRNAWKSIGSALTDTISAAPMVRVRRSQSEPIIIPRRKPIISDEVLIQFGEHAAAIAAQLKHYTSNRGIWSYKHPHTDYLYSIFHELVEMREQVRVKLIHRKQCVEKLLGMPKAKTSVDRFYTRFQWIKNHVTQPTSQLIFAMRRLSECSLDATAVSHHHMALMRMLFVMFLAFCVTWFTTRTSCPQKAPWV